MRPVRGAVAVVLVCAAVLAGCASSGEAAPGLLSDATAPADSPCPEAEVLTALLASTGVAYDYEPADSPRELALTTDAVVRGRLTGRVEPADGEAGAAVDLGVEVLDVVLGEDVLVGMTPPLSRLRLTVSPGLRPGEATTLDGLAGLDVVAFVHLAPGDDSGESVVGIPAAMQGLVASCAGDRLEGWHGAEVGWPERTLDEVALAALGLPETTEGLEGRWDPAGEAGGPDLEVSRGPEHCGWESTLTARVGQDERLFVRDPEGATGVDLVGTLDLTAAPPAGDLSDVWSRGDGPDLRAALVAGQEGLLVQVDGDRWERWPEVVPVVGCA